MSITRLQSQLNCWFNSLDGTNVIKGPLVLNTSLFSEHLLYYSVSYCMVREQMFGKDRHIKGWLPQGREGQVEGLIKLEETVQSGI